MFRRSGIYFLLVVVALLSSCRAVKTPKTIVVSDADARSYLNRYSALAVSEMKRTGVPASITLAQGMIESDYGRSSLAREANNHFGIKCHDDWTGAIYRHDDDRRDECFRRYSKAEDSFKDHSDFLKRVPRYKFLFSLPVTDYKGWAKGLKLAGYATNPDYANMLIRTIEANNLNLYDNGKQPALARTDTQKQNIEAIPEDATVTNRTPVSSYMRVPERVQRVMENNRIQYIIVRDGETKESIEQEFQLLKWELSKYNEISAEFVPVQGQILYLQPKRDKAEPGKEYYIAVNGDTMYSVSQKFGVKIKKLYEYNRMGDGSEPVAGDKIYLRDMKPVM
jgi:hypothetical protein